MIVVIFQSQFHLTYAYIISKSPISIFGISQYSDCKNTHQRHCNDKFRITDKNAVLSMSLLPLSTSDLKKFTPRAPTVEQWKSYWGSSKMDKLQKVLESLLITYGGAWLAWFFSFMAGSLVSSIIGTLLVFNWIYAPWLSSIRMNRCLWTTNSGKPSYHAIFSGTISSLRKIKRRSGKSIGAISQEYLVVLIEDSSGRELEVIACWRDLYMRLKKGDSCQTVVASSEKTFSDILLVTDIYVSSSSTGTGTWIGDFPYLLRDKFLKYSSSTSETRKFVFPSGVNEGSSVDEADNTENIVYLNVSSSNDVINNVRRNPNDTIDYASNTGNSSKPPANSNYKMKSKTVLKTEGKVELSRTPRSDPSIRGSYEEEVEVERYDFDGI